MVEPQNSSDDDGWGEEDWNDGEDEDEFGLTEMVK